MPATEAPSRAAATNSSPQPSTSPCPPSPGESVASSSADCTDAASDNGIELNVGCCVSPKREASGAGRRGGKTNSARLSRYHRERAELLGLRHEAMELQTLLDKLKAAEAERDRPPSPTASLSTSPSPFTDNAVDEVDPRDYLPPKPANSPWRRSTWRRNAEVEFQRRRRAHTVKRKLMRLLREYRRQSDEFMNQWCDAQMPCVDGVQPTVSMPLPPGTDTMEAFTRNGVVMLQELYHMACSACCIAPAATAPLDSCGGALAYSFLLGPEIESGWSSDFAFPGDDPCNIGSHYLRALTTQTPDKSIVSTAHKAHSFQYPCLQRKYVWRYNRPDGRPTDFQGVSLMQRFEADGQDVFVWTLSLHPTRPSAPPLFRASGWMVLTKASSSASGVTSRVCARVHRAPSGLPTAEDKTAPRTAVVRAWADTVQARQQKMWDRLLLIA